MQELVKSMVRFSGAMTAFGMQRLGDMLEPKDHRRPYAEAARALDVLTRTSEAGLRGYWKSAYQVGQRWGEALIDATFDSLPTEPHRLRDVSTLPIEALHFVLATGQLVPSSNYLAAAMTHPLPLKEAKLVVELGPGTGVMTRALLERLPDDGELLAFETNPHFVEQLRRNLFDTRLQVVEASAEAAGRFLRRAGRRRVDGVVSSLGLTFMPDATRRTIIQSLLPYLDRQSVFTQFQYLHAAGISNRCTQRYDPGTFLDRYFRSVTRQVVWFNIPPATVFTCREPASAPRQ